MGHCRTLGCRQQTPQPTFSFDQTPYSKAQDLVEIGDGRQMNLYCVGKGSPAVILESGFGSAMWTCGYVQGALGKLTRTCAYDRAGYGFSDPGPLPRLATPIANDLHELLVHADIRPPYILVGHSLGSYDVRMFADLYPNSVMGLVLIDPATQRTASTLNTITEVTEADRADTERRNMCERLAQQKEFESALWERCVEKDPRYSSDMVAGRQYTKRRPGYWMTVNSEYESGAANESSLSTTPIGFRSKPLIVLTASDRWDANVLKTSPDKMMLLRKLRLQAHREIASESSLGIDCVVNNTSHFIQIDQPAIVISAVQSILNTLGGQHLSCPFQADTQPNDGSF
jgi:pimeloyl-ACP methyl ester carboxylesterase